MWCDFVTLLIIANMLGASTFDLSVDEAAEPAIEYEVWIDGQQYTLQDRAPQAVQIKGIATSLEIKQRLTKRLKLRDLSFEYPSYFYFVPDDDSEYPGCWSVKGRDTEIIVYRDLDSTEYDDLPKVCEQFCKSSFAEMPFTFVDGEATDLELGSKTVAGRTFIEKFNEETCVKGEYYVLPGCYQGSRYVLVIVENADSSIESGMARHVLEESFKWIGVPD